MYSQDPEEKTLEGLCQEEYPLATPCKQEADKQRFIDPFKVTTEFSVVNTVIRPNIWNIKLKLINLFIYCEISDP